MPNAEQNLKRIKKLVANRAIKDEWNKLHKNGIVQKEWANVKDKDEAVKLLTHALSDKADERKQVKHLVPTYAKAGVTKVEAFRKGVQEHTKQLAGLKDDGGTGGDKGDGSGKVKLDPKAERLNTTLEKLMPSVEAAIQNNPPLKSMLRKHVSDIQQQITQGKLEQAKKGLLSLNQLVAKSTSETGGGGRDDSAWVTAKKNWTTNKKKQVTAIQEAMNTLRELGRDEDMPKAMVEQLYKELSGHVRTFTKCIETLDSAIVAIDKASDDAGRKTGAGKLTTAKTAMTKFCTGARLQSILTELDGKDFFKPTLNSLQELKIA